jgi:hypothetical protein
VIFFLSADTFAAKHTGSVLDSRFEVTLRQQKFCAVLAASRM